jgi:IS30 family transposase
MGKIYNQLSKEERYAITAMRLAGIGKSEIARRLGRDRTTIWRELKRNRSVHDDKYRAMAAHEKANGRRKRSRKKIQYTDGEQGKVWELIREDWSPEQVSGSLKEAKEISISHETIYRWLWMDKRKGGTLWKHLRGSRKIRRKRYGCKDSRGRLAGKKMIGERPPAVDARSRLGDWEIDTVHGKGKACVVTIVERKSGLVRIGKLSQATKLATTARTIDLLWADRCRVHTITSDNGGEFHDYKRIEEAIGVGFYFAQPHHAWERGSNENANGLIRQYLPKGMDLINLTQKRCEQIAEKLNNRPRKRLGFKTPNDIYDKLL